MMNKPGIRSHTGREGLTLVEIMMTLLILGVVMGVVTQVFFGTQGMYARTSQRADQQMSTRAGLTVMTEEIRRAGADPNATGIAALMTAETDTVRVRAELNDVDGIQTAEPSEDVTYYYDDVAGSIMRDNGTGSQPMIQNVTGFQIQYFDANNNTLGPLPLTTAQADDVRSVGLTISTDTPQGGQLTVNTRVGLRNNI
jgi:prepilin-type N-terminal cleavage/methylation domain-containing protein